MAKASTWSTAITQAIINEFDALRGSVDADAQAAYMKHVAPFLGIATQARTGAVKRAMKCVGPPPTSTDLAEATKSCGS